MKSWKIKLHRKAKQELERIHPSWRERIISKIKKLADDPFVGEKLHGEWQGFRKLRIGNYRIVYVVEEDIRVVAVLHVGSRGDIYKKKG